MALLVVATIAVAYLVIVQVGDSVRAQAARRDLAAARSAASGLEVPADFVRLRTCLAYACFRVPQPTASVAVAVPAILRSVGARSQWALQRGCSAPDPRQAVICRYAGRVYGSIVEAWLSTYVDCNRGRCRVTGDSRVDVWEP